MVKITPMIERADRLAGDTNGAGAADVHSLAAALRQEQHLDDLALSRAEELSAQSGDGLPKVLNRLGLVSDAVVAKTVAQVAGTPLADLNSHNVDRQLLEKLGSAFAASALALPLECAEDDAVPLAMSDPTDQSILRMIALRLNREVVPLAASVGDIEATLERLQSDDDLHPVENSGTDEDLARLRDQASEAPVIKLVNQIVRQAVELGASDIHIEPLERMLRLRYRVDGALRAGDTLPVSLRAATISRIKIMAGLDIAESRLPQDGRVKMLVAGKDLDLRVATSPTLHGEGIVIRILDRSGLPLSFSGLGFEPDTEAAIETLIRQPNGIVLVTGPTGSGKTTTLYAALAALNDSARKIITVEDPVEYRLEGVNQIQVHTTIGLNFAEALRSILRQDPDIIMIGEIRDLETARIAVQAALTGHLVLATLHTNSAVAAVARLRDMGIPDYLLTATLNGAIAQRLVRRICPECRAPDPDAAILAERLSAASGGWTKGTGCAACAQTGYRGRTSVVEVLSLDRDIRQLIIQGADEDRLTEAAKAHGMRSLADHALSRAANGETTLTEALTLAGSALR